MISIVMPLLNVTPYFYQCLEAIKQNTRTEHEIIIIHSKNCNRGIRAAKGDAICLLNDDTIVQPNWLKNMVKCMAETEAGIVGCKMYFPDEMVQHTGMIFHKNMTAGNLNWRKVKRGDPICNTRREFQAVTFGCALIRRDVFDKVGLLDENYQVGSFEDVDFCHMARKKGYKIVYEPTAEVMHYEAATMNSLPHGLIKQMHWQNYEYYKSKWEEDYKNGFIVIDDEEEIRNE